AGKCSYARTSVRQTGSLYSPSSVVRIVRRIGAQDGSVTRVGSDGGRRPAPAGARHEGHDQHRRRSQPERRIAPEAIAAPQVEQGDVFRQGGLLESLRLRDQAADRVDEAADAAVGGADEEA